MGSAPGDVTVSMSTVLREWGWMAGRSIALRFSSKSASQGEVMRALEVGVPALAARVRGDAVVTGPLTLLTNVVVLVYDCPEKRDLISIIDEVVEMVSVAGLSGKFTCGGGYTPMQENTASGFVAGVALAVTRTEDDRPESMQWDPDPVALQAVVDFALGWCRVEDGRYWVSAGVGILANEGTRDEVAPLLSASLRQSPSASVDAVRGMRTRGATREYRAEGWDVELVRRIDFDQKGHVTLGIGSSTHALDWRTAVGELQRVLIDLAPYVHYGLVAPLRHVTNDSWRNLTSRVSDGAYRGPRLGTRGVAKPLRSSDPRAAMDSVPTAYGIQLLGPGHPDIRLDDQWDVQNLDDDRRLVMHRDLGDWFATEPAPELLARTRLSFGDLVEDQAWQAAAPLWSK